VVMPQRAYIGEPGLSRPATPHAVDFSNLADIYYVRDDRGLMRVVNGQGYRLDMGGRSIKRTKYREPMKNSPETGLIKSNKQQRARLRRRVNKGVKIADEAWNQLYKPIEEWDMEELARGRPRNAAGNFIGPTPQYMTRELHERAMERFKSLIRNDMNAHSITALKTIQLVLESEEVDARGKPIVPASTKMDAAKFLLEHIVGKPTQPTTADISVKLQGILGTVMVNPMELQAQPQQYQMAHTGSRELEAAIDDEDEDYDEAG
jgi:hypothetical protein